MSWVIPVLEGIGAGASAGSAVANLFNGGGGSSASGSETQVNRVTPGSLNDVGSGASDIWNQAADMLLGRDAYTPPEPPLYAAGSMSPMTKSQVLSMLQPYLSNKQDGSYNLRSDLTDSERNIANSLIDALNFRDNYMNFYSTPAQPSVLDMMQGAFDYKKNASDQYLSDMSGADTNFLNALDQTTGKFNTDLSQAKGMVTNAPFYVNLGGRNVGAVPKGNRDAATVLSQIAQASYNAGVNNANTGYQVGSNAAGRNLTQAETYAPNTAELDFFNNILLPAAFKVQNLRYGIPSTTTTGTGSVSSTPSFLERLQQFSQTAVPAIQQLQDLFGNNQNNNSGG